jgi:hypothetical protein
LGRKLEKPQFTRFVFPYSLNDVPSPDKKLINQLLHGEGFATAIRLPLLAEATPEMVMAQIEKDVDPALLIFLNGIDIIEIWAGQKRIKQISRKRKETEGNMGVEITLYQSRKVISRWLLFDSPVTEIGSNLTIRSTTQSSARKRRTCLAS